MPKSCVTTAKDFELFKREAQKWLDYFGLHNWRVEFGYSDEVEDARAWFDGGELSNHVCQIALSKDWGLDEVTSEKVRMVAFHEVLELFFYRVKCLIYARFVREEEIQEEIHNLIRTLENTVYRDLK